MSFPGHYEVDDNHAGPSSRPADHYTPDSRDGRRPWSPINYNEEVAPQGRNAYFSRIREWDTGGRGRVRKQEASEDSIEALDLADYARTLRRPEAVHDSPYPPFPVTSHVHPLSIPTPQTPTNPQPLFAAYPEYPPSPPPVRPFSVQSRDTFSQAPPSLISGESTYETQESYTTGRPYDPRHRPYSLPSFLAPVPDEYPSNRGPAIFSATSNSLQRSLVRVASPTFEDPDAGDISRFPPFSRHWFDDPSTKSKSGGGPRTSLPAYSDLSPPPPSLGSRNVLPWSARESDSGPPIDESTKQERMRMLEYEFGKEGKYDADGDEPVVGSVDEKGALITSGPKKRAAARWAQGLFGLAAVVSSVYGALFIKSPTPAPPSGQAPAFTLYGVSIISFLLTFYLFAIRPCCCGRRKKEGHLPGGTLPGGLVALPIQSLPGGKKAKKKGKKGKKGDPESGGDVQVNLIVDPGLFNPRHREDSGDDDEDFDGSQWSSRTRRRGGKGNGRRPRRSVFEGFAMETEWRYARNFLKKIFALDVLCCLVWAAVFVFVLFGKRCPSGQFNGWCDSYNLATAATAFTCLAFAFSTYFDIVDLHASRASPRTRT